MNLRYYIFVCGVKQRNEEVTRVYDFLVLPQRFESFSRTFHEQGGVVQCVCVWMIKPIAVGFCSIGD